MRLNDVLDNMVERINQLEEQTKGIGECTSVTGTMTTVAWANPTTTTTWTAPSDGIYMITMHIVTANDTANTSAYKMFRWYGTAQTLSLEVSGLYFRGTTDGASYGINGTAWTFPVKAKKGDTVKSGMWTGVVFSCSVQIVGVKVGQYY